MELQVINNQNGVIPKEEIVESKFIEANTIPIGLEEIQEKHIIPVFVKDNTPLISQADFISSTRDIVMELSGHNCTPASVRVSHAIKGRVFEARNKKASELLEHEKTIYYERMAFISEMPSIIEVVNGQEVTMCFGGVKAYNQDNLNNRNGADQRFKFFMGFKVKVCTNLCVWTDGFSHNIRARSLDDLSTQIYDAVNNYSSQKHLEALSKFSDYNLTEKQFATLIGKTRMLNHLPRPLQKEIPKLLISDSQISLMTKEYYSNSDFSRKEDGSINLWDFYNLLTGAVKSSYIDSFLDRNANAFSFTKGIGEALEGEGGHGWFLN